MVRWFQRTADTLRYPTRCRYPPAPMRPLAEVLRDPDSESHSSSGMESYPSAQEPFNIQSDNQSTIAQSATHNKTAAHTIHSAYKPHTTSTIMQQHTTTQSEYNQHTASTPWHTQQHAPVSTRLPFGSRDAPYYAVVLRTYNRVEQSQTRS